MSQAAGRTIDLLEAVLRSERPPSMIELAKLLQLDKSTTSRLLGYLVARELLYRDPLTKRYEVGSALLLIAGAALRKSRLSTIGAARYLEELRDRTGETASLHVRQGRYRVCIAGSESRHDVRRIVALGDRVALYDGPASKVILAYLPADEQHVVLAEIADEQRVIEIRRQLGFTRQKGYMAVIGDRTPNVGALATAIFDARGVAGSIVVSGPVDRWTIERMEAFAPALLETTATLSQGLGGSRPPIAGPLPIAQVLSSAGG